jgi:hypothetical protein
MPIDAFYDDLDSLRELVSQLSSERDAALAECKRVTEQNDRLRQASESRDLVHYRSTSLCLSRQLASHRANQGNAGNGYG